MLQIDEISISPGDLVVINFINHNKSKIDLILDANSLKFLSTLRVATPPGLSEKNIDSTPDFIQVDAVFEDENRSGMDLTRHFNMYKSSFVLGQILVDDLINIVLHKENIKSIPPIKHLEVINSNFELQIWNSSQIFKI